MRTCRTYSWRYMKAVGQRLLALAFLVLITAEYRPVWAGSNAWTSIGPNELNISSLAVDPQNPSTIFAGTYNEGNGVQVFKSTDAGVTWNVASHGLPTGWVTDRLISWISDIVIDPKIPRIVYLGIVSWTTPHGYISSVFKSVDGGATWTAATSGLPLPYLGAALAIDPQNPSTLYAAGYSQNGPDCCLIPKIFKSTDGGTSWNATVNRGLPTLLPNIFDVHVSLAIDPQNPRTLYVGLYGDGIFKSVDSGTSWTAASPGPVVQSPTLSQPISHPLTAVHGVIIDPENPNIIYAATRNFCGCMEDPRPTGVWKSTDGGTSWSNVLGQTNIRQLLDESMSIAMDPQSAGTLYAGTYAGVFKSTDGGGNWISFNGGLNYPDGSVRWVSTVVFTSGGPHILYAAAHGLFKITDEIPVLTLNSREYCTTSSWRLNVSNALPNASIQLSGVSNGQSWEVRDWRKTDGNGSWSEAGGFAAGTEGRHLLRVDVGEALSNVVSFVLSNCSP